MWWTLFLCSILCLCHWVSHFLTKKSSVADQAAESQFQQRSPAVTTHPHPNHWEGDVMATETRGHSWCSVPVGLATAVSSPVSCGAIGMADVSSVESTEGWLECGINFFFLSLSVFLPFHSSSFTLPSPFLFCLSFPFSGEEAHHRPVRGPERWTQPDLLARGPLWSHPGMDFYSSLTLSPAQTHDYCVIYYSSLKVTLCSRLTRNWWQSWTTWRFITSMSVNRVASVWAPAVWLMPTRWCKSLSPNSDRQAGPPRDTGWFRGRQVV